MDTLKFVQRVTQHAGDEGLVVSICGTSGDEIAVQLPKGHGRRGEPDYRDVRVTLVEVDGDDWKVEALTELGKIFLMLLRTGELRRAA